MPNRVARGSVFIDAAEAGTSVVSWVMLNAGDNPDTLHVCGLPLLVVIV